MHVQTSTWRAALEEWGWPSIAVGALAYLAFLAPAGNIHYRIINECRMSTHQEFGRTDLEEYRAANRLCVIQREEEWRRSH